MLMVLGAGCSSVTQVVAEAAVHWNLLQVTSLPKLGTIRHIHFTDKQEERKKFFL